MKALRILGCVFLCIITVIISASLFNYSYEIDYFGNKCGEFNIKVLISCCIMSPLMEELVFRKAVGDIVKKNPEYLYSLAILSSFIFGVFHGSIFNVWVQGIVGFYLFMLYVKNGYSYWSSVIAHFLYNVIMCFVLNF